MGRGRSVKPSHWEMLERRVLLSAYTLSQLGYFGTNATGMNPESTLVADSSGNLYGTATKGGAYGGGTVFEIALGSGTITTLASFNGTNGQSPYAGVALDSSGNLYGTTTAGGSFGQGTVFGDCEGFECDYHPCCVQREQRGIRVRRRDARRGGQSLRDDRAGWRQQRRHGLRDR